MTAHGVGPQGTMPRREELRELEIHMQPLMRAIDDLINPTLKGKDSLVGSG